MKLALWVVICSLTVAHSKNFQTKVDASNVTPRSVNLAVETVLKFDDNDRGPSLKVIKDMQHLFNKLNRALDPADPKFRNTHSKLSRQDINSKLKEDVKDTINTLLRLEDMDLENIVKAAADELNDCEGCLALLHELTDDKTYRRSLVFIDTSVKTAHPSDIRDTLIDAQEYLNQQSYSDKEQEMFRFLESMYSEEAKKILSNLVSKLGQYREGETRRSTDDIVDSVKNDLRNALDTLANLSPEKRRSVKMKLDAFWGASAEDSDDVKEAESESNDDEPEFHINPSKLIGHEANKAAQRQIKKMVADIQRPPSESFAESAEPVNLPHKPLRDVEQSKPKEKQETDEDESVEATTKKPKKVTKSKDKTKSRFALIENSHEVQTLYPVGRTQKFFRKGKAPTTPKVNRVEHSFGATINVASLREMLFQMPEKPKKTIEAPKKRSKLSLESNEGLSIELSSRSKRERDRYHRRMNSIPEDVNGTAFQTNFSESIKIELTTQEPQIHPEIDNKNISIVRRVDETLSAEFGLITTSKPTGLSETVNTASVGDINPNLLDTLDLSNKIFKIGIQFE